MLLEWIAIFFALWQIPVRRKYYNFFTRHPFHLRNKVQSIFFIEMLDDVKGKHTVKRFWAERFGNIEKRCLTILIMNPFITTLFDNG